MKNRTISQCMFIFLQFTVASLLITCEPLEEDHPPLPLPFSFSIKNEANAEIKVKLDVGIIPTADAQYTELLAIPDDIYRLGNENWSSELGTKCTIKPKKHNKVNSYIPIINLGQPSEDENHTKLRKALLDKLISFTLTIYRGDEIIHRITGWNLLDDDMAANNVHEKYYGYYNTAEEKYTSYYGYIDGYPRLYSKFLQKPEDFSGNWDGGNNPLAPCYFIKVQESGVSFIEFNPDTTWLDIDDFWRKH